LTCAITHLQPGSVALMVAAFREAHDHAGAALPESDPRRVVALSRPDGSWRYSRVAPADDAWARADFDDSGWDVMELGRMPVGDDASFSRAARLEELGAQPLATPGAGPAVWVRSRFDLSETASPASPERRS
jgi:hypothetical protein